MDQSDSQMVASINDAFKLARVRCWCFGSVIALDLAMKNGHTVDCNIFERKLHAWTEEEYQNALARIRDYGIMNGLTAHAINETFRAAHDGVVAGVYK